MRNEEDTNSGERPVEVRSKPGTALTLWEAIFFNVHTEFLRIQSSEYPLPPSNASLLVMCGCNAIRNRLLPK